jgi:predicted nucleotidyltransferase
VEKALKVLGGLRTNGLIEDYAIGGGIATIFYIEAILTYDLDIFVIPIISNKDKKIIDFSHLYKYLTKLGYKWKGEHIIIEGIPVQFIPVDQLEEEAVRKAKSVVYKGVTTKVLTVEYLIAILIKVGRSKDIAKVSRLIKEVKVDKKKLQAILNTFNLTKKYQNIKSKLL